MTIDLTTEYAGQVITTDPNYPLGKARNRVSPTDNTGTPYEAKLVNDLHGAHQALLAEAGVTASGNPDQVGTSDVVDSIMTLIFNAAYGDTWTPGWAAAPINATDPDSTEAFYALIANRFVIAVAKVTYTNTGSGAKTLYIDLPPLGAPAGPITGFFLERNGATVTMGAVGGGPIFAECYWSNTDSSGSRTAQVFFAYRLS